MCAEQILMVINQLREQVDSAVRRKSAADEKKKGRGVTKMVCGLKTGRRGYEV